MCPKSAGKPPSPTPSKSLLPIIAKSREQAAQVAAGREHLTAIEADAKAKGYSLIARKAATARG